MDIDKMIVKLLKTGAVSALRFGLSPQGEPYVQADQMMITAPGGNMINCTHQRVGQTVGECLMLMVNDLEHCALLHKVPPADPKSNLIVVPGAN